MLLNAFKTSVSLVAQGIQTPFNHVYLPIQSRLFTHSITFIYPFNHVYLPFNHKLNIVILFSKQYHVIK